MPLNAEAEVFRGLSDTGSAVVVRPNAETAVDYFARLEANKNKIKFDDQSAALRALDSIKGWSVDQPYFSQRRAGYIKKATDAMKGKYTQDPNYIGGINQEQDDIIAHAALSNETKANYDFNKKLYEQHPESYSDNAMDLLEEYARTPLEKRDPTWVLPQLRDADFGKYYASIKPPHYKAGEKIINADGTGSTAFTDTYKEKEGFDEALKLVSDPDSKMAIGLKKNLLMGTYPDEMGAQPDFKLLPYAEQQKILNSPAVNKAAATHVATTWKNMFAGTDKSVIDKQKSPSADDSFTKTGTKVESKNFIYEYEPAQQNTTGYSKPIIRFGRNPKLAGENPKINIDLNNAVTEDGKPLTEKEKYSTELIPKYWEQQDDGSWLGVGIVKGKPEYGLQTPDRTIKIPQKDFEGEIITKYGKGLNEMIELTRPEIGTDKTGVAVGNVTAKGAGKQPKQKKIVTTKAEFEALPSGATYYDAQGNEYKKK